VAEDARAVAGEVPADVDVAFGGHLVAKALKTEGVWILISALAGKLSLKILS
jgi:hypothetical protein